MKVSPTIDESEKKAENPVDTKITPVIDLAIGMAAGWVCKARVDKKGKVINHSKGQLFKV